MSVDSLCIHEITVQRNTAMPDGRGGMPDNWIMKYANVKARVRPVSARESGQWGGVPTTGTHIVYVSDAALGILEKDRIVFGTRIFNVLGVRNIDEWDKFLTIDAEEVR